MINSITNKLTVLVAIMLTLLLGSCGNLEKIEIGDPEEVKIQGFEDNHLMVFARIPVNNPSIYSIKIKEIDVRVHLNGQYIGKLIVDETIKVKRKDSGIYELPVKIRLANVLGAAFIMMNTRQGEKVEFRFEGRVKAQTMLVTKEFPIDETKRFVL
jgi:LEA14-like dessication related protein